MKWYNYKDSWINIEKVTCIDIEEFEISNGTKGMRVTFNFEEYERTIKFTSLESDAEFEKIKELMGIRDYTSRCC